MVKLEFVFRGGWRRLGERPNEVKIAAEANKSLPIYISGLMPRVMNTFRRSFRDCENLQAEDIQLVSVMELDKA